METTPPWVLVITKPSAEEVAERNLRQAGYRVYLPRYRKLLRPHGSERRGYCSMRPLFAGYLFVNDWRGWPDIPINGVLRLMQSGGRNVEMSFGDVERIWQQELSGRLDEAATPRSRTRRTDLQIGETYEFDMLDERVNAVLSDLTDSGKAIVRAMMFGREIPWTVDAADLRAISG